MSSYTRIGLDIGAGEVKAAQLTRCKDHWVPCVLARKQWCLTASDEAVFDLGFTEAVRSVAAGAKGRRVVLSAPTHLIDIRPITVPLTEGVDLMSYVRSEVAERCSAFSGSFVCDYWIAGETVVHGETKLQVYSVSAPNEPMVALVQAVERAGLICTHVDVPATALARAIGLTLGEISEPLLILDIGARCSMLVALEPEGISFCRQIKWGGAQVTANIKKGLDIDTETAEHIKVEWGLCPIAMASSDSADGAHPRQQVINDSIEQELRGLALEIGRSLAYRARSSADRDANTLIVVGGGSRLNGLDRFIHDALKLDVRTMPVLEPADDWPAEARKLAVSEPLEHYGAAVGAALVGVN